MHILSVSQMLEIEKRTIEEFNVSAQTLMDYAGKTSAYAISEIMQRSNLNTVIIFAGKGNNGGDGFAAASHLENAGFKTIIITTFPEDFTPNEPAELNFKLAKKYNGITISYAPQTADAVQIIENHPKAILIDAMLGIGLKDKPHTIYSEYIEVINQSRKPVISLDIPSGLNADTGKNTNSCVIADATVTMGFIKKGMLLHNAPNVCGKIIVADIGFPKKITESFSKNKQLNLITPDIFKNALKRKAISHKGDFGKIIICAGSEKYSGAAVLSTLSATKSGAGLVFSAIPKSLNTTLSIAVPESIKLLLPENKEGCLNKKSTGHLKTHLQGKDALAIGCGLGNHKDTLSFIRETVLTSPIPVILDADGINAFAGHKQLLAKAKSKIILTPHLKEFSRISEQSIEEIEQNKIEAIHDFVNETNTIVILKNHHTICVNNDLTTYVNITGNPGMATGGSGDCLTGVIAALIGQKIPLFIACLAAVYSHGLAGDIAATEKGQVALTATDIIEHLPEAFKDSVNIII